LLLPYSFIIFLIS